MINVLVFPCGSEIGLEVHNALKYDKHINLIGLSSVPCHGRVVYENYIEGISFINSNSFIKELNTIIDNKKIDVIIPAYDDVILFLSEHNEEINCKIITSNIETCDLCRSKINTYEFFKNEDFVPKTYNNSFDDNIKFPLFAKPDIGQGSQGIKIIKNYEELQSVLKSKTRYVVSEYLPGEEYTIDCFTNSNGDLIMTSMRERKRIKSGISVNSVTLDVPNEVLRIAKRINDLVKFSGVWFFQVKKDINNRYKLLEMAPRVAGSMSTSRMKGFNFILNAVYQEMGYQIKPIPHLIKNVEIDRALSNKYLLQIKYDCVYIDFDDTITLRGKVNTIAMSFLYQCLNNNIKIILLTRHSKNIVDSLYKYHIDVSIFSEIIHITDERPKSDYINENNSIFIDDSFKERYDVSLKKNIPVFDVDGIEALIDWRL